jgi:hypothetical protein|tara:strand:+ start:750 stop:1568 length:819 start_codon:yes stop_codon:yes gene_type:complete
MPPYGIDSLLNRDFDTQGYFTSPVEEIYDPAFGTLNFRRAYGPAPFTGNIPLTSYRVEPGSKYISDIDGSVIDLGFKGDIELPSFGGVSGYRDTGGIMGIEPAPRKTSTFVEDDDLEASALSEFAEGELKQPTGLQTLLSFLPFGSNSILGRIGQGISNTIKGSRFYRPATTGIFGFSPAELNRMNALGGFYSEPAREGRRRANRISNMLRRAAAGKNFSRKNLDRLMSQAGMGDVDTGGMIQSMRDNAGYKGGFDRATGNYDDPLSPGDTE